MTSSSAREYVAAYSVVRLAPDPLRQEFVNVGIVLATESSLEVKVLPAVTPHVRAVAPPKVRRLIYDLEPMLRDLMKSGVPSASLAQLAEDGLSGFEITPPRRVLIDSRSMTPELMAERLYREQVAPRHWRPDRARGPQLESVLRRSIIGNKAVPQERIALGLRIRTPLLTYSFPLAFANGQATIVQGVDLSVSRYRQEEHTLEAIARIAEATRVLPIEPRWISVVKPGDESLRFRKRLTAFSTVLGFSQLGELGRTVAREAERSVEDFFTSAGVSSVERREREVEVVLAGN